MSARGSYRSIHTVLIDGPDYQALPPAAKLVFLTLKLNLGPTGIDVLYSPVIEAQTGLSSDQVLLALTTLEHANWLRREKNVVWLIDGLKYEPSRTLTNANHRSEITAHLNSLPRLNIVESFRQYYDFPAQGAQTSHTPPVLSIVQPHEEGITDGMGDGMGDAIPEHGRRKTEDGRRKTEDGERKTEKNSPAQKPRDDGPRFDLGPYLLAHRESFPGSDPPAGRYGRVFKRLEAKHGGAETLRRWRICLERKATFATPEELSSHWPEYEHAEPASVLEARAAALVRETAEREHADAAWLERRRAVP